MKQPISQTPLTEQEKKELIRALNKFERWIVKKKIVPSLAHINHTVDLPFSTDDWVMAVDEKNKTISFNTFVRNKCSANYYKSIVLHEFFHLAVQKVPNKDDAVKIKDDFGDELMRLIDIEADFFTALFYKEELGFTLPQYLTIYFEGSQVFSNKWIRIGKLERFIGTLLSICKMFINHPKKNQAVKSYDLYLPSITPLYTEDNLHVLVLRKEHIYFDLIKANQQDFIAIKDCYKNIDTLTVKGYIEKIVGFACKALALELPVHIRNEINKL